MPLHTPQTSETVTTEQARMARELHTLADEIDAAASARMAAAFVWIGPVVEVFMRTVRRALAPRR